MAKIIRTGINSEVRTMHERVEKAISESPYLNRKNLQFEMHRGHINLSGRVKSFFHKQMAQEALRGVEGIEKIRNNLEVDYDGSMDDRV